MLTVAFFTCNSSCRSITAKLRNRSLSLSAVDFVDHQILINPLLNSRNLARIRNALADLALQEERKASSGSSGAATAAENVNGHDSLRSESVISISSSLSSSSTVPVVTVALVPVDSLIEAFQAERGTIREKLSLARPRSISADAVQHRFRASSSAPDLVSLIPRCGEGDSLSAAETSYLFSVSMNAIVSETIRRQKHCLSSSFSSDVLDTLFQYLSSAFHLESNHPFLQMRHMLLSHSNQTIFLKQSCKDLFQNELERHLTLSHPYYQSQEHFHLPRLVCTCYMRDRQALLFALCLFFQCHTA